MSATEAPLERGRRHADAFGDRRDRDNRLGERLLGR
jgi:hypothetical protein